jgi:hypothetical protein
MHPLILQLTDRVNDMIAAVGGSRRARAACPHPAVTNVQAKDAARPAAHPARAAAGSFAYGLTMPASWASRPAWVRLAQPSLSSTCET